MRKVLVKRTSAVGDVLLTTPIVKRLYDEGWEVSVQTKLPEIFRNNPYIARTYISGYPTEVLRKRGYKIIDLDMAYENNPRMHIVDAYSLVAFGDRKTKKWPLYLFYTQMRLPRAYDVVVHPGVGWENRTFSKEFWHTVMGSVLAYGCRSLLIVGSGSDHKGFSFENWSQATIHESKFDLQLLSATIKRSKLFIGPDSAPLHIAQTTTTPCIGLFTCAKAEYRLTSPHAHAVTPYGDYSGIDPATDQLEKSNVITVRDVLDCYGCLHDAPPPVTYIGCRRGDFICVKDRITPEMVMEKVREVLNA